jgi:hypothetical protein
MVVVDQAAQEAGQHIGGKLPPQQHDAVGQRAAQAGAAGDVLRAWQAMCTRSSPGGQASVSSSNCTPPLSRWATEALLTRLPSPCCNSKRP